MADTKITDLTTISSADNSDLLYIVDVSDTTDSAAGSSRKITKANLLTSVSVTDANFTITDNSDATKILAFELSGITTGTTRTLTVPNASTTLVGTDATQTLTNKTLTAPVISTISNTGTLTLPTATTTLVGLTTTDTLTNKTLTAPKIATGGFIADENGNEQIIFTTTAAAVNEATVTNAATANNPSIAATGGDTNISLQLSAKGTGYVLVGSTGTATASAGAATSSTQRGTITSEALTTAAGADYTLTLTNTKVSATSIVLATADNGTNTTEGLAINRVTPGSGSVVIKVRNTHASSALNGTIKVNFVVL